MNILGLISQLIGIKTLRLTQQNGKVILGYDTTHSNKGRRGVFFQ